MTKIIQLSLSASGSPSDVKARLDDQIRLIDANSDQAAILAVLRQSIEKGLTGLSEDSTLAVTATVNVAFTDPPAVLVDREASRQKELTSLKHHVATLTKDVQQARNDLNVAHDQIRALQEPKTSGPDAAASTTSQG